MTRPVARYGRKYLLALALAAMGAGCTMRYDAACAVAFSQSTTGQDTIAVLLYGPDDVTTGVACASFLRTVREQTLERP